MDEENTNAVPEAKPIETTYFMGLASFRPNKEGQMVLRPIWMRVFLTLVVLLFLGWTTKSVFIYSFFKYKRDFDAITVVDSVVFPLNRTSLNRRLGAFQVKQGIAAFNEQRYRDSILLLKVGLSRCPDNQDGIIALSEIFRATGQRDFDVDTLRSGLAYYSDDPGYIKLYLQTLLKYRRDSDICAYADKRFARAGTTPTITERIIGYVAAQVAEANGQFAKAIDYLEKNAVTDTAEGCMLLARCHWRSGDREGAVTLLRRFLAKNPQLPTNGTYSMLCTYLHELGRDDEALTYALTLANMTPKSFLARRLLIQTYRKADKKDRARIEEARFVSDFATSNEALASMGDVALNAGDVELATRVYETAAEQGFNMSVYGLIMIDTLISSGDYQNAFQYCDLIQSENPEWMRYFEGQFNFLRVCAARRMGQDAVADLYLSRVLDSKQLRAEDLFSMAERMRTLKLDRDSIPIYEHARKLDPKNERIAAGIVSIDIADNLDTDFVSNVDDLLSLRRPENYDLLRQTRVHLTSDHFIFDPRRDAVLKRLDAAIAETAEVKPVAR